MPPTQLQQPVPVQQDGNAISSYAERRDTVTGDHGQRGVSAAHWGVGGSCKERIREFDVLRCPQIPSFVMSYALMVLSLETISNG